MTQQGNSVETAANNFGPIVDTGVIEETVDLPIQWVSSAGRGFAQALIYELGERAAGREPDRKRIDELVGGPTVHLVERRLSGGLSYVEIVDGYGKRVDSAEHYRGPRVYGGPGRSVVLNSVNAQSVLDSHGTFTRGEIVENYPIGNLELGNGFGSVSLDCELDGDTSAQMEFQPDPHSKVEVVYHLGRDKGLSLFNFDYSLDFPVAIREDYSPDFPVAIREDLPGGIASFGGRKGGVSLSIRCVNRPGVNGRSVEYIQTRLTRRENESLVSFTFGETNRLEGVNLSFPYDGPRKQGEIMGVMEGMFSVFLDSKSPDARMIQQHVFGRDACNLPVNPASTVDHIMGQLKAGGLESYEPKDLLRFGD